MQAGGEEKRATYNSAASLKCTSCIESGILNGRHLVYSNVVYIYSSANQVSSLSPRVHTRYTGGIVRDRACGLCRQVYGPQHYQCICGGVCMYNEQKNWPTKHSVHTAKSV